MSSSSADVRPALEKICARCFKPATSACTRCKSAGIQIYYCSRPCQEKDWKLGHKSRCGSQQLLNNNNSDETSDEGGADMTPPTRWLSHPDHIKDIWNNISGEGSIHMELSPTTPPPPPSQHLVGLVNPKNICYLNSVLQCLTATRPLMLTIYTANHANTCQRMKEGKFCMWCIFEKHTFCYHSSGKSFLPIPVLRHLSALNDQFSLGMQEDAHDFARSLLLGLQDSLLHMEADRLSLNLRTQETTLIHSIFGGYLRSQLTCNNCHKRSNVYEAFLDLNLEISDATDSLAEMLESYTHGERLDDKNQIKCSHCQTMNRAYKRLTIHEPPNILTVSLKRFRPGLFGKVNKYIEFPAELSLRPFLSPSTIRELNDDSATLYKLYAVLVHLDLLNISQLGHYITYIKPTSIAAFEKFHRNKKQEEEDASSKLPPLPESTSGWYRVDDEKVDPVTLKEVLGSRAYLLFYERVKPFAPKFKVQEESKIEGISDLSLSDKPTEPVVDNTPKPCTGGCGFFGSKENGGLCSVCFKKSQGQSASSPSPVSNQSSSNVNPPTSMEPMLTPEMLTRLLLQQRSGAMARAQAASNPLNAGVIGSIPTTKPNPSSAKPSNTEGPTTKGAKIQRNDPCPCGSGQKFKKCHGK